MPPSFAITELVIVLTAAFCSVKLRKCYPFASIGIILFGLAALIGVYRFLSGEVEQLASIHKYFSQAGALLGLILITKEIILAQASKAVQISIEKAGYAIIIIALFFVNIFHSIIIHTFILCALVSVFFACRLAIKDNVKKLFFFSIMSLMPLNLIFVRNSEFLSQIMSWHAFHTIVAAWIYGIYYMLNSSSPSIN